MSRKHREYLRTAVEDGLPVAGVGQWAEEKYRRLGRYAEMFSTAMKNKWDRRIYVDLYSGPGHAIVRETRRRVLTSPLLAVDVRDPFDRYVFCDQEPTFVAAVTTRAEAAMPGLGVIGLPGDVNLNVAAIASAMAVEAGASVINLCFVDPYNLDISFNTIRALADQRVIDFLMVLMLPIDAKRNEALYVSTEHDRIDRFLGGTAWRARWASAAADGTRFVPFLAREYSDAMGTLGYLPPGLERMVPVKLPAKNVPLYYLAFFSRNERGYQFWDDVRKRSTDQFDLQV